MARKGKSYKDIEKQVARIAYGATGYLQPTDYYNGTLSPDYDMMKDGSISKQTRTRIARAYEIANRYRSNIKAQDSRIGRPFLSNEQYRGVSQAEHQQYPRDIYTGNKGFTNQRGMTLSSTTYMAGASDGGNK